jgi:hypothetical protein
MIGATEQTYYRWKKKFGGLRIDHAKRLKDLGLLSRPHLRWPADSAADDRG